MLEKYEKSCLHQQILSRKALKNDHSAIINLHNLNKTKETFNASKNKFDRGVLFEYSHETSPGGFNSNDNTTLIGGGYNYNKRFEPFRLGHKVKSKEYNDSFEVTPETETQISFAEDNNTARLNFNTDLNEHTHIRANILTPGVNLVDKSVKAKEEYYLLNSTKKKFSWTLVQFLDVDAASYENYLKNQPNFGLDFCREELKIIREYYYMDRLLYTEKTKIFLLLRILHQKILGYISEKLRVKMNAYQYPLLSMKDPAAAIARSALGLNPRNSAVQTASLLFDLVPQTLLSFYPDISRNYEDNVLKTMIVSMIEELYYYEAFPFLEKVRANTAESMMMRNNAARTLANLKNLYNTLALQTRETEDTQEERTVVKQRTRTLSPRSSPHVSLAGHDKIFSVKKRVPSIGQAPPGIQLSPKISFGPIKLFGR